MSDSPFNDERRYSQDPDVRQRRRTSLAVLTSAGGMRADEARHVMIRLENAFEKRDLMRAFGRWRSVMLEARELQLCMTARDALNGSVPGAARTSGAVAAAIEWARRVHTQSFERCEDTHLADSFRHAELRILEEGEPLFLEGDVGTFFVLMFTGSIAIFVGMPAAHAVELAAAPAASAERTRLLQHADLLNGGSHSAVGGYLGDRVHTFAPGSGFGEVAIGVDGSPARRSASAVAAEDGTEVLLVPAHVFARSLMLGFGDRRYKRLATLKSLFLFDGWNRARLISLAVRLADRVVKYGSSVLAAGEELPGLVIIVSGSVTTCGSAAEAEAEARLVGGGSNRGGVGGGGAKQRRRRRTKKAAAAKQQLRDQEQQRQRRLLFGWRW